MLKPLKLSNGFTFLGLLVVVAIAGIGMAAVGVVWSQASQRDREQDLLYIGKAYQRAIGSYFQTNKRYPQKLENLVRDESQGNIRRHLRKLYKDPITRGQPWGLIKQSGGITGVFSTSIDAPIKQSGFKGGIEAFSEASTYQDWVFRFVVPTRQSANNGLSGNASGSSRNDSGGRPFGSGPISK